MEELVQSYNKKYNEMLTKMLNEQEELIMQLKKNIYNNKVEQIKLEEKSKREAILDEETTKPKQALKAQRKEYEKKAIK
jgi:phosphodiesterase/alkaline phosphatase D-like protein